MNNEKDTKKINSDVSADKNSAEYSISDDTQNREENMEQNSAETEEAQKEEKTEDKLDNPGKTEKWSKSKSDKFKKYMKTEKFRYGGTSVAFTAGFIVIIILINIIVGALSDRYPSMNIDLTKGSMNTLSEKSIEVVDKVKIPTEINIIAAESQIKGDVILAEYGIKYSQVGELAVKIAERNSNIKVNYIDLDKNPTFANQYASEKLMTGSVVIKTDKRHRVLKYTDLFNIQYSQDGMNVNTFSMVDSALASGLNSVIADNISIAAFETSHNEVMDTSVYKKLLQNNCFETKEVNLLTGEIPQNTGMLVLGCPSTDFTKEEIKKMDNFLSSSSFAGDRTVLITFDPAQNDMPNLSEFLKEWGIDAPQSVIVESDQNKYYTNDPSYILSNLQSTPNINKKADYGHFTTPRSKPFNILFDKKGTRKTYSLAKSNDTCLLVDNNTKEGDNPPRDAYNTAVLSQDIVKSGNKKYKANVIALGSTFMFNAEILSADTFGNSRYVVDLAKYGTGTTDESTAITQVPVQTNVSDITLSTSMSVFLGIGIFTLLIPLLIAIAGICVYRKRRHL